MPALPDPCARAGSFCRIERTDGSLSATVDGFATRPLFWLDRGGDAPLVSDRIADLVPHLSGRRLDPAGYAAAGMFGGRRNDRTPFAGIARVPPGHVLNHREGRTWLERDWSLIDDAGPDFPGTAEDAVVEIRRLVLQAVERCLAVASPVGAHVSGGIDSSSVAALAMRLRPGPLHGYSVGHPPEPDNDGTREHHMLSVMQRHCPDLVLHTVRVDATGDDIIDEADNWHGFTVGNPFDHICADAAARGIGHILTGIGGDEIVSFGSGHQNGLVTVHNDWQARQYRRWSGFRRRTGRWRRRLLGQDVGDPSAVERASSALRDPANLLTAAFVARAPRVIADRAYSPYLLPSSPAYRRFLVARSWITLRCDLWAMMGRRHGVRFLHPLLDRDLVSFCMTLPKDLFRHPPGQGRPLFRRAMAPLVPPELVARAKRPVDSRNPDRVDGTAEGAADRAAAALDRIDSLRGTFAATVYDVDRIAGIAGRALRQREPGDGSDLALLAGHLAQIGRQLDWLNRWFETA